MDFEVVLVTGVWCVVLGGWWMDVGLGVLLLVGIRVVICIFKLNVNFCIHVF